MAVTEVAGGGAVALSMDEQRILEEMERRLADDDPRLASRLASFSGHGLGAVLRSPRARLVVWVATLTTIAVMAVLVYSMMPFRTAAGRPASPHQPAATRGATTSAAVHSLARKPAAKASHTP
jgi:hypothetical protein